jgi:hypothetical protein
VLLVSGDLLAILKGESTVLCDLHQHSQKMSYICLPSQRLPLCVLGRACVLVGVCRSHA